jgi:hypothetical protein
VDTKLLCQQGKDIVKSFAEQVFNKHEISENEKYFANESPPIGILAFKKFLDHQQTKKLA